MKRIEVKLSLPVVAPLLDVIKEMADGLQKQLAAPIDLTNVDAEFGDVWTADLLASQREDVARMLALFGDEFFTEGVIAFDEENAEAILRSSASVRLRLREVYLKDVGDEVLEESNPDLEALSDPKRKAFMCYLFLATIQELIIQHLDSSILGS